MKIIPALLVAAALITPALAQDKIVTTVSTDEVEGQKTSSILFYYAGCEEECNVATFSCSGGLTVSLELPDKPTGDVTKAMLLEQDQVVVKADGTAFGFQIQSMTFAEMTGAWWVTANSTPGESRSLPDAMSKATSIDVTISTDVTKLPADANLKTWAQACR